MGGAVGLKGTDGLVQEAMARGARPLAAERARACLRLMAYAEDPAESPAEGTAKDPAKGSSEGISNLLFLTASGDMGESILTELGIDHSVVYQAHEKSSAEDTKAACKAFLSEMVDLVLFCGGDGTARDVASVIQQIPILGIPAGVKMHSGVFAISPEAAAELALGYARGELNARETEVVDVDEELYRSGELQTRLYATAKTPYRPILVQERKRIYASTDEEEFKDQIAIFAREFMRDGSAYILGAGTTTARIAEIMGLEKTLLGVDVIQNEKLVIKDASERDLLDLLDGMNDGKLGVKIIVSPIGAQGFIFGRGSQQISADVLCRVVQRTGVDSLIIVSTPHKLSELKQLLVDTGSFEMDKAVAGRRLVVTGYRMAQRKDVRAASELKAIHVS